jgi:hypothetical protein
MTSVRTSLTVRWIVLHPFKPSCDIDADIDINLKALLDMVSVDSVVYGEVQPEQGPSKPACPKLGLVEQYSSVYGFTVPYT